MGREWVSWIGGGGNSMSSAKREKMASGGCMCAVLHLFHAHRRNHSNTYPFIQEQQPTTTTGLDAPRNSLEELKQEEDLKFPVGIKIKSTEYDIASECDSPGSNTPSVVARLMGLDLFPQPQCTSPSITTKSPLLLQIDVARSLPETPRTSSSSRKSDVERHRLSLEMNKENVFSPSDGGGRLDQDDRRIRSVGPLDITNTYHTKSKIVSKDGKGEVKQSITNSEKVVNKFPIVKERQQSNKASGKCKKLPREDGFVGSKEKKKSNLAVQKNCKRTLVQIRNGAAKLPHKQVSNAIFSWKSSTQLSTKPCIQTPTTVSPAAAPRCGAWSEQKNFMLQILLKLKAGAGLSRWWERKLIFELVDELLAENLTRQLRLSRRINPVRDDGGCRLVEELCKKIGGFPAAKCVVLEDIDSLIDKDWCKENWDGFQGEEEDMVGKIECEIMEWLVDEVVAVMGGDAAEELLFVA
ncbi:uncharacterized protein LOC121748418 isoform X2 [Salvia splendens]|uniref:uncharacterized protein LOC121748418 isoform X2 n=1 Tax=Salvia splendens TaxID=180675 RepID=UPI001C264F1C|nr:uncharacterized protein LOC121748418 isoform X2 [Salvia splendens]